MVCLITENMRHLVFFILIPWFDEPTTEIHRILIVARIPFIATRLHWRPQFLKKGSPWIRSHRRHQFLSPVGMITLSALLNFLSSLVSRTASRNSVIEVFHFSGVWCLVKERDGVEPYEKRLVWAGNWHTPVRRESRWPSLVWLFLLPRETEI